MISVASAQELVLAAAQTLPAERVTLSHLCVGRTLAEEIFCDRDSPPFPKSLVDGFAVRSQDFSTNNLALQIQEEVFAGTVPTLPLSRGVTTRVMTGAPLPLGTDAVVMQEKTTIDGSTVYFDEPARPGQNLLPQGAEMRAGATVMLPNRRLRPVDLGVLASVDRVSVALFRKPQVAILSTGDEIVEPGSSLGSGQIRNSNGPLLAGLVAAEHAEPMPLGIAADTVSSLQEKIRAGLQADVLVLSGGVSAGKADLVPQVLADEGVTPRFHRVAIKPGKPLYFGVADGTLVFGLPGNPVACLVGFHLFILPALRKLQGLNSHLPTLHQARLIAPHQHRSDRPTYHPARIYYENNDLVVKPLPWKGSADLFGASQGNGWLVLEPGEFKLQEGDGFQVLVPGLDLN